MALWPPITRFRGHGPLVSALDYLTCAFTSIKRWYVGSGGSRICKRGRLIERRGATAHSYIDRAGGYRPLFEKGLPPPKSAPVLSRIPTKLNDQSLSLLLTRFVSSLYKYVVHNNNNNHVRLIHKRTVCFGLIQRDNGYIDGWSHQIQVHTDERTKCTAPSLSWWSPIQVLTAVDVL